MPNTRGSVKSQTVPNDETTPSFTGTLDRFVYRNTTTATTTTTEVSENANKDANKKSQVSQRVITGRIIKSQSQSQNRNGNKYAHLNGVPDAITPGLLVLLVGHNPGVKTAQVGHAYAHPSNLFWKLLQSSGLTDRLCRPEEDQNMPGLYRLGLTNIVARPSRDIAELSRQEQTDGTPILEEKIRKYKPEVVCFVGKSNWEAVYRYRHGKNPSKSQFKYGWQDGRMGKITAGENQWPGARIFVATSTSGLAASLSKSEKEEIWKELGDWVIQRRLEIENEV